MKVKIFILLTLLIVVISCNQPVKQDKEQNIITIKDWSSPEKINPLESDVGDFLDNDMRDYMIKADKAYWEKDYKLAAQYYLYMLSHNIYDIVATYNLACTYGLMGKPELCTKFLFKAIDLGFVDFKYIKKDTDFDKVRGTKVFDAAIDSIGQVIKNLGDIILIESKTLLKCRVTKPLAFYPDKDYKLVIGLHEYSSSHNSLIKIWKHFDIPEFIFAVPQAPYGVPIGLANEFRWNIDEVDNETIPRSELLSREYIVDVITELKKIYNVNEVYLLGLHQGTSVAFDVAFEYPELITGVIAFGTGYDISKISDQDLKKASKVKFFISNSFNDAYIDSERCELIRKKLENNNFDVEYKELDTDYSITREVLKESEKWFLQK